jgi:YbbR domain-containing protein
VKLARLRTLWPLRHFGLKVLSLGLALLLWVTVAGEQTVERSLRVPLEFQQFPAGLELRGEIPATVDVRVRGTSGALSRLAPGDVVAVLDLRAARPGQRLFHLTAEQVRTPFGVEVVQVTPPSMAMAFDGSASKLVPVIPPLDGRPAAGFVVGKWTAEPAAVEVIGPASAVQRVSEAVTEPVTLAGAREQVREKVTVGLLDPALRLKTPGTAMVTVQIVPAPLEHRLRGRPVHLRNLAANLFAEAQPSTVDVTIRGSREALGRLEVDDIAAYVDLAGLGAGQYTLNVRADSSLEAGVTHVEPATVQVRIFRDKK